MSRTLPAVRLCPSLVLGAPGGFLACPAPCPRSGSARPLCWVLGAPGGWCGWWCGDAGCGDVGVWLAMQLYQITCNNNSRLQPRRSHYQETTYILRMLPWPALTTCLHSIDRRLLESDCIFGCTRAWIARPDGHSTVCFLDKRSIALWRLGRPARALANHASRCSRTFWWGRGATDTGVRGDADGTRGVQR